VRLRRRCLAVILRPGWVSGPRRLVIVAHARAADDEEPVVDAQPSEPDGGGGQAGKAASRPLPWRALLLVTLAGAAGFALIFLTPGLDTRTRAALAFILAPVVVTPIFCLAAGFNRGSLVVGSVMGGEIAALLYAAGQSGRFARWLAAVEVAAMLLTPGTLSMLRAARIPGVPQGDEAPSPAGIVLIIVLAPAALAASVLHGMARFPAGAVIGCLLGCVAAGFAARESLALIAVTAPGAVLLGLAPAAIRRVIVRARRRT
jgi:hypothetical protein